MRIAITAVCALALSGCVSHQITDRSDFLAEGTRIYQGEPRERVIEAARIVLRHSDPTDFEFRDTLTGFTGIRKFFIYAVLAAANGREKWEFQTEADGKAIRAAVSVSESGASTNGYSTTPFEGRMASVPLYRLFWDRVEFVLGRRPDWVTCEQAEAGVKATGANSLALGGLCGPTSDGRSAPPPEPLPRLNVARRGAGGA